MGQSESKERPMSHYIVSHLSDESELSITQIKLLSHWFMACDGEPVSTIGQPNTKKGHETFVFPKCKTSRDFLEFCPTLTAQQSVLVMGFVKTKSSQILDSHSRNPDEELELAIASVVSFLSKSSKKKLTEIDWFDFCVWIYISLSANKEILRRLIFHCYANGKGACTLSQLETYFRECKSEVGGEEIEGFLKAIAPFEGLSFDYFNSDDFEQKFPNIYSGFGLLHKIRTSAFSCCNEAFALSRKIIEERNYFLETDVFGTNPELPESNLTNDNIIHKDKFDSDENDNGGYFLRLISGAWYYCYFEIKKGFIIISTEKDGDRLECYPLERILIFANSYVTLKTKEFSQSCLEKVFLIKYEIPEESISFQSFTMTTLCSSSLVKPSAPKVSLFSSIGKRGNQIIGSLSSKEFSSFFRGTNTRQDSSDEEGSWELTIAGKCVHNFIRRAIEISFDPEEHLFLSATPLRLGSPVEYFIDGKAYFGALRNALIEAKAEIFLTGWMISPSIYLVRSEKGENYRLDEILLEKAKEGVKIYILLWNETKIAMPFRNNFAENHFVQLHPNIRCVSHPYAFPLYWSHHQKIAIIDQKYAFVGGMDLCFGRYDSSDHSLSDECHTFLTWPGKDYYNPTYCDEPLTSDDPYRTPPALDRNLIPRMPWHDIALCVGGKAARDVSRTFIIRWNHHCNDMKIGYPSLFPSDGDDIEIGEDECLNEKIENFPFSAENRSKTNESHPSGLNDSREDFATFSNQITQTQQKIPSFMFSSFKQFSNYTFSGSCICQVVRSMSLWSGSAFYDTSLHNSMVELLLGAKHFIYIENQYFITFPQFTHNGSFLTHNLVGRALYERLRKAIIAKETFRVVIVLPEHSEGSISSSEIQIVMKNVFATICRGEGSLFELLHSEFPEACISDYLMFFSLRKHQRVGASMRTELIYVHSKLLIVDDDIAIVGSGNINDRSLVGYRDSEIAVVVRDNAKVKSMMNGKTVHVSKFAHFLRVNLWLEHLGMLDDPADAAYFAINDPIAEDTYQLLISTATSNTFHLQKTFGSECLGNHIKNISDFQPISPTPRTISIPVRPSINSKYYSIQKHIEETNTLQNRPAKVDQEENDAILRSIKGHIILFPTNMLENEPLYPQLINASSFVDYEIFQ